MTRRLRKLEARIAARLEREKARKDVRAARAARASVANGAAALAPGSVTVGLRCPRCGRMLVAATVNGREVGAPFCPACGAQ